MLTLYNSNRLEILVEYLVNSLKFNSSKLEPSDPFKPELVVVPHQAMGRWLTNTIAQRTGVCANFKFLTPAQFFWRPLRGWNNSHSEYPAYGHDSLRWRILQQLPELIENPAFATIKRYLTKTNTDWHRLQLAQQIADMFEHYLLFRPSWMLDWEQGAKHHWQAHLWRALATDQEVQNHWGRLLYEWRQTGRIPRSKTLPQRVTILAINQLNPVYAEIISKLKLYIKLQVLHLNPIRNGWIEQLDPDGTSRCQVRGIGLDPHKRLDLEQPLVAILGHKRQVLLQQFLDLADTRQNNFVSPSEDTLLHRIQSDILELRDRRKTSACERIPLLIQDLSLQIHSCHSPSREVQVLSDRLLHLFETTPQLTPGDVVVMAPDIKIYAPYIEAVFGTAEGEHYIPWIVSNQQLNSTARSIFTALDLLLTLPTSRFEATKILSLLQVPAIQRRFDLDATGLERIYTWIQESGIRWGIDADHRKQLNLPEENANTWSFGLQRLFLGLAMNPDPQVQPYCGVLPYPDLEGNEVVYLGILQTLLERLVWWQQQLQVSRPFTEWQATLTELCADIFSPDADEQEALHVLYTELESIATQIRETNFTTPLSSNLFYHLVTEITQNASTGLQQLFNGRVNFCSLETMSTIPFRVVCLLGINGIDFPRRQRSLAFDLMANDYCHGDPSRRRDDNSLFLDAILAAKDCLYISYIGHDFYDNNPKPPSVLVSALLDYITQTHQYQESPSIDGTDPQPPILLHHPLQPFSKRVFDGIDPRLRSYASEWLDAARSQADLEPQGFASEILEAPEAIMRTVDIKDLTRCLWNPAKYFLTERLGLKLLREKDAQEDTELFGLDSLQDYNIKNDLLTLVQAGWEDQALLEQKRAAGIIPHGAMGEVIMQTKLQEVRDFAAILAPYMTPILEPIEVDLTIGEFHLTGHLKNLRAAGIIAYRSGLLRGKDRLGLWIQHLVLCALRPGGVNTSSLYIASKDGQKVDKLQLTTVTNPEAILGELLDLYWQALVAPLPFFTEYSWKYCNKSSNINDLRYKWNTERYVDNSTPEDYEDSAVQIAFRDINPVDASFMQVSNRILEPLIAHSL